MDTYPCNRMNKPLPLPLTMSVPSSTSIWFVTSASTSSLALSSITSFWNASLSHSTAEIRLTCKGSINFSHFMIWYCRNHDLHLEASPLRATSHCRCHTSHTSHCRDYRSIDIYTEPLPSYRGYASMEYLIIQCLLNSSFQTDTNRNKSNFRQRPQLIHSI